jgi:hypothetical protein
MATTRTRDSDDDEQDAGANGVYSFLDVGRQKYGECTVVRFGDASVIIDGSHEGDFKGQEGYDSIPEQLRQVFRRAPPYDVTLMVVTHCHADHVGCLPKLVSEEIIRPRFALLTDRKLGFGRTQDDADAADLADDRTRALAAALREEDASDLADDALQTFIDAVATVESKYAAMVADLRARQVEVIEYRGQPLPQALVDLMRPAHMALLGPSRDQLVLAAEQIAGTNRDAADAVKQALGEDATLSNAELYRRLSNLDRFDDVSNPRGSGMNCQSITLAFGPPGARVLLAGDMQFADPNVAGADGEVAVLRARVRDAGPYRVFKATHHTAHNGQDVDVLGELGNPPIIVHSGGLNDPTHPDPGTLEMLKRRSRSITFARTDRNGLITVRPHLGGERAVTASRGRLNNFTSNAEDPLVSELSATQTSQREAATSKQPQVIIVNLPEGPVDIRVGGVDIVVSGTHVTASKSAAPDPAAAAAPAPTPRRHHPTPSSIRLGAGRQLPPLLFVTNSERLEENIGAREAAVALDAIRAAGHRLCDLAAAPGDPGHTVRALLRSEPNVAGVVIAGGYDVVGAPVVDVLTPQLREALGVNAERDQDHFIVWSDEPFGDIDGDHIAERPVSRVPDARDAALFLTALEAKGVRPSRRFGIRNIVRPFAETVWKSVAGEEPLEVSETFLSSAVQPEHTASSCHYFMLHGTDTDSTLFTGEREDGSGSTLAFAIDRVPATFNGIVFSGCCWGALTVSNKAVDAAGTRSPAPRVAERSIALAYLKAGANAFIGCTGAHYSGPDPDPEDNYAVSLHEAFWQLLPRLGHAASPALFGARMHYGKLLAEHRREPLDVARRLKNRTQFTCLGLGW